MGEINITPFTISTARRVETAETNTLQSRLFAISNLEGNPQEVHIENFGNATAFIVKGIPDPYFNSVRGVDSTTIDVLDDILKFYRNYNATCRFDFTPFDANPELLIKLAERGFYQYGFHSSLYGIAEAREHTWDLNDTLTVRKLNENEFNIFGEIYTKAFKMPELLAPAVAKNNHILYNKTGWHFYIASYNGIPAAIAVLFVQDSVGSLAAAATLPGFQGRGCQSALLSTRINEAAQLDCDLVVSQASFGSISKANMERIGLRTAYTKSLWKAVPK
ncbi:MAG: acetyltransferase [Sporomusa sp.]|nr:acetyltransferase [Sporomusa sp.]